mmetsp:Transcript_10109/g.15823  ORF Transcript_10109/g.15823 Transcript_10109/m.15823 type:complete len:445 (+) Transcript_10109:2-1336(+)
MNWCSRPRPKLDLSCCGTNRRADTVNVDISDGPKLQVVLQDEPGKYTYGSVCIDRNGMHKRHDVGAASKGRDSSVYNGVDLQRRSRMSRSSLEQRRADIGARNSGIPSWVNGRSSIVPQKVRLDDLTKIKVLGKGISGTVWKVMDQSVREILALKEMALEADPGKCALIIQEMQIMLDLDHPNVIACHGVFFDKGLFQIVMEFMDAGSMLDLLRLGDHKVPVPILQAMSYQILLAMNYLHKEHRVIHRDVKPGNILVNRKGEVKLADFGVCSRPRDERDSLCATWVGTVTYMSPERIVGNKYTFNSDVWALGVILVEAALGRYPYLVEGMEKKKFEFWDLLDAMKNSPCVSTKLPQDIDTNFRSFTEFVLQKEHDTRPSSEEALSHPFLQKMKSADNCEDRVSRWILTLQQDRRASDAVKIAKGLQSLSIAGDRSSMEDLDSEL